MPSSSFIAASMMGSMALPRQAAPHKKSSRYASFVERQNMPDEQDCSGRRFRQVAPRGRRRRPREGRERRQLREAASRGPEERGAEPHASWANLCGAAVTNRMMPFFSSQGMLNEN